MFGEEVFEELNFGSELSPVVKFCKTCGPAWENKKEGDYYETEKNDFGPVPCDDGDAFV